MNSFLKLLPALALTATVSLAQAQVTTPAVAQEEGHMPMKGKKMASHGKEDYVVMQDGKMMRMQDGQLMPLTSEMTMVNGTKVMPNGNVMMAGGKSMMLKNGQCVLMDGKVKMMGGKMMKDKMSSSM